MKAVVGKLLLDGGEVDPGAFAADQSVAEIEDVQEARPDRASAPFENVTVVSARAEEFAQREGRDRFGTAVARALAPPPVAAEWCLPLVREGGCAVLLVGESADAGVVAEVAAQLAAEPVASPPGLLVMRKIGPTPERFPRRPGIARKRPLA